MAEDKTTQEILQRLVRLETLLEAKLNNTDARIKKLEDTVTWLWRSIIGTIITTIGSIIVVAATYFINK